MHTWIKALSAELSGLARRPGAAMALIGFLLAQMSLQADVYVPEWVANSILTPAVFWIGEAMILVGVALFIAPDVRRFLAPPRVPQVRRQAETEAPAA